MTIQLLIASALLLAASGVPGLLLGRRSAAGQWIATALNFIASVCGTVALIFFWADPSSPRQAAFGWALPFGQFAVGVDTISSIFLIPMFLISAAGAVYGLGYWPQVRHPRNGRKLRLCWGLLAAGMVMVVLARDGILLLMAWEVMALSAFFLVTTEDQRPETRQAGWIYLVATHVGALSLFAFVALLGQVTGSFDIWPAASVVASPQAAGSLFIVGTIGFGIKAGIIPLHVWLPGAHSNAPSHVSAMMSGVMLKAGVYGLVRVGGMFPHPPVWWGATLLVMGTLSAVLGIALAAGQRDLKRLLAYSSIENIGIIAMGLGLAMVGRSVGRGDWIALGLGGALLHVLNHSLFKPLLFLGAGGVLHAAHSRMIDRLGGLAKLIPATFLLFVVGAAAICGLPPLNGFVSELLVYLGLFHTVTNVSGTIGWITLGAPALALVGAMAVVSFVKVIGVVFAGNARSDAAKRAHDPPKTMLAPMAMLAACCLCLGLFPFVLVRILDAAVHEWAGPAPALSSLVPLRWISGVDLAVVGLAICGGLWLYGLRLRRAAPSAPTWDCGYARPTRRMQYSGSSFSQVLIDLLGWVLLPRRQRVAVSGPFPATSRFRTEVPDPVLDRGLLPTFAAADGVLAGARVLHRGTIQIYLLYVIGILLFLLLIG